MSKEFELDSLSNLTVMVTGAAGFIGSHVLDALNTYDYSVLAVDGLIDSTYPSSIKRNRWNTYKERYKENFKFIEGDLADKEFVQTLPAVNFVINLAALPGLMMSWTNLDLYLRSNVTVLNNLIEYSKFHRVTNFVHASTSSVYGEYAKCDETGTKNPVSPYGVTKLAAENLILAHHHNFGFPYTILRYFSVYGPQQRPDMFYAHAIKKIVNQEKIEVFGDGEQTRSNTYAGEVAAATIQSLDLPKLRNGIFNVSGEEVVSVNEALRIIGKVLKMTPEVVYLPKRPGDQFQTLGDSSRIRSAGITLGKITFEEGITFQIEDTLSGRNN